jgi:hypothetical protein
MVDGASSLFLLSSDSPDLETLSLLRAANAPLERLTRPVISFVRDDLLISLDATNEIVAHVMDEADSLHRITNSVFGNWTEVVTISSLPIHSKELESDWQGDRRNVVVLNTGAHWSPVCFEGLGENEMLRSYTAMVRIHPFFVG